MTCRRTWMSADLAPCPSLSPTAVQAAAGQYYFCTAARAPSPWPGSAVRTMSSQASARVITLRCILASPTAPPAVQLASIASLAAVYAQLLRDLGLNDVCVVGNSIGGWIAAELALAESAASDRRVGSLVLVDAAGLAIDGAPIPDFFSLTLDEVFDLSYFNPDKFQDRPGAPSRAPGGAGGE